LGVVSFFLLPQVACACKMWCCCYNQRIPVENKSNQNGNFRVAYNNPNTNMYSAADLNKSKSNDNKLDISTNHNPTKSKIGVLKKSV